MLQPLRQKGNEAKSMVIRNRLVALLYRLAAFSLEVYTLTLMIPLDTLAGNRSYAFVYFGGEVNLLAAFLLALEIIFNTIDLFRHGLSGVAAYVYMPISLGLVAYFTADAIAYSWGSQFLNGYATGRTLVMVVMSHAVMPLLVFFDWILFDEKGSVKWVTPFEWLFYPFFYYLFIMLDHYVWKSDLPYDFLDNRYFARWPYPNFLSENNGWNGIVLSGLSALACFMVLSFFLIFLNNFLAGQYRKKLTATKF